MVAIQRLLRWRAALEGEAIGSQGFLEPNDDAARRPFLTTLGANDLDGMALNLPGEGRRRAREGRSLGDLQVQI